MVAYIIAKEILEIKETDILKTLGSYTGAWRRMEFKGNFSVSQFSIPVYDDYAHHPTEIKASLLAFREKYSKNKIICVYQPHQALRLKNLFSEFVDAFKNCDILILIPVYEVAGRDRINREYTSEKLVSAIFKKYPKKRIQFLADPKKIKRFLTGTLDSANYLSGIASAKVETLSPIIVMMGAGTISEYTKLLIK